MKLMTMMSMWRVDSGSTQTATCLDIVIPRSPTCTCSTSSSQLSHRNAREYLFTTLCTATHKTCIVLSVSSTCLCTCTVRFPLIGKNRSRIGVNSL